MKIAKSTSLILLACLGILVSCRKEKLSSDYSYLYGKWKWTHTYRNLNEPGFAEFNPTTDGNNYSMEISKKCIVFFKNEKKELKRYFKDISVHPGQSDTSKATFFIALNKKDGMSIDYYPNKNHITIGGFPFDYITTGDIGVIDGDGFTHINYFQKE